MPSRWASEDQARDGAGVEGGGPGGRWGLVHFLDTSWRCHRKSVSGRTRNERHASRGSSLPAAARNALSEVRYTGRLTCRRRMGDLVTQDRVLEFGLSW
jgi:hypothetical protein